MAAATKDSSADSLADTIASDDDLDRPRESGQRSTDSLLGLRLDHFLIERPLGKGGMGAVYVAHDTSLDRRVAIKVLRADLTARPDQEERFLREARAQACLNHANVVHIYFIGRRPRADDPKRDSLYFAMELVDGESLDGILERGERMDPEDARETMLQVAKGLRAAHRAGIVHRDVKPSNLIRDSHGIIKIADFGLAKPIESDTKITQDGGIVGSPLYMAPEQAKAESSDHRADMYSLGATFFHLLAGRPPFEGDHGLAVIAQHLSSPPPRLGDVAPKVPLALRAIIDRLMSKAAADRYPDYDALIQALEEAAPSYVPNAGFWTRGAAVAIDSALAAILIALIGWPGLVIHLLHVTLGHAFLGLTIAKYFLKIEVRRPDGSRLGFVRSLVRTVTSLWAPFMVGLVILVTHGIQELEATIEQLSVSEMNEVQNLLVAIAISHGFMTLVYAAGLSLAAFHPQKRALHDLLVGSVVKYRLSRSPNA